MTVFEQPQCTCGSRECGLVWIPDQERYQCGTCIHKTYAALAGINPAGVAGLIEVCELAVRGTELGLATMTIEELWAHILALGAAAQAALAAVEVETG